MSRELLRVASQPERLEKLIQTAPQPERSKFVVAKLHYKKFRIPNQQFQVSKMTLIPK